MNLKNSALLILAVVCQAACGVFAQSVTSQVRFDTYVSPANNDLVNNFSNTAWVNQVTSGGITGGALAPPDSISWGNDLIYYCRNYFNISDTVMENSICFQYDASKVRPSAFQRAADIWLFSTTANHYIIYSVNYNHHLTILSYGSGSDSLTMPLVTGNWYKLVATCKTLSAAPGDWVYTRAEVFDLGASGTGSPVSIGSNTISFHDLDVVQSNFISVSVSGAGFGGSTLLDDFSYQGIPASNSCSPAGLESIANGGEVFISYPQPALNEITVQAPGNTFHTVAEVSFYNAMGERLASGEKVPVPFSWQVGNWPAGMYFLEIRSQGRVYRNKILKQ